MKLKHDSPGLMKNGERSGGRGRLFMTWVLLASGGACTSNTQKDSPESIIPSKAVVAARGQALAESCTVKPPFTGNFEPELKWSWTGGTTLPEYKQVMMTPAVVDLNGGSVEQGDVLRYTISGTNTGQDGATSFVLRDPIPANTTYKPGSIVVTQPGGTATARTAPLAGRMGTRSPSTLAVHPE